MAKIKLSKKTIAAVTSVACAAVIITTLLIVNIFYPLKYFTAYIVRREPFEEGELEMCVLDVGQADCTIVSLPDGRTLLIDGGDGTYRNNLKILTELNRRGVDYIDYVICTTVDDEYCGGLGEIIRNKDVGAIFYPFCNNRYICDGFADFISAAESSGAQRVISEYGAGVSLEDFYFTFLSPSVHTSPTSEYSCLNSDPSAENIAAASAVMWLEYAGAGILYAGSTSGDKLSEIAATYALMQELGDPDGYFTFDGHEIDLSACVAYKVPAHAADSALATDFTDLISPQYSFVSVGENNAEGCPSVFVLADLLAHAEGVQGDDGIFMTMYDGDITLTIDADGEAQVSSSEAA